MVDEEESSVDGCDRPARPGWHPRDSCPRVRQSVVYTAAGHELDQLHRLEYSRTAVRNAPYGAQSIRRRRRRRKLMTDRPEHPENEHRHPTAHLGVMLQGVVTH